MRSTSFLFCVCACIAGTVPAMAETGFKTRLAPRLASECSLAEPDFTQLFRPLDLASETLVRPGVRCRSAASRVVADDLISAEGGFTRDRHSLSSAYLSSVPQFLSDVAREAGVAMKTLAALDYREPPRGDPLKSFAVPSRKQQAAAGEKFHSGKMSWFGQYNYGRHRDKTRKALHVWRDGGDNGQNASGLPQTVPGIALTNRKTLGHWYEVKLNGKWFLARHVDLGPARYTGRAIDINAPLADMAGWSPKNFPTDKTATWRYVGRLLPQRLLAELETPADQPRLETASATPRLEVASLAPDTSGRLPEERDEQPPRYGQQQARGPALRVTQQFIRVAAVPKSLSTVNWPPLSRLPMPKEHLSQPGNPPRR